MDILAKTIRDTYGHEHVLPGPYTDMSDVRRAHAGFWFTEATMRVWGSRIPSDPYCVKAGRIFISSEKNYDNTARVYTVRIAGDDGAIENAVDADGKEMQFDSLSAAKKAVDTFLRTPQVEKEVAEVPEEGGLEL